MNDPAADPNAISFVFQEGDQVTKQTGDYVFTGVVISAFHKRSGSPRYAVENEDGVIHIFNHAQLRTHVPTS